MKLSDLFPVIVLFRCQLQDAESYTSFLAQLPFRAFMVYDNSPSDFAFDSAQLPPHAVYKRNIDNGGVSAAYNCAATYASEHDFKYLLLLDQDTHFPPNAIEAYLALGAEVTLAAPRLVLHSGQPFSPVTARTFNLRGVSLPPGDYALERYSPVNCGMCIALDAFFRAEGYNPRVSLDYADFEFCRRMAAVHPTFRVLELELLQDFSNDEQRVERLAARFRRYLSSAVYVTTPTWGDRFRLAYQIGKHTLSLTARTRSFCFLKILSAQLFNNRI